MKVLKTLHFLIDFNEAFQEQWKAPYSGFYLQGPKLCELCEKL